MRLLAPLLLALLGALVGLGVRALLAPRSPAPPAAIAGAVGGFSALVLRDVLEMDVAMFGGLTGGLAGGLVTVATGAAIAALPVVLLGLRR